MNIVTIQMINVLGMFVLQIMLFNRFNNKDYKNLNYPTLFPLPKFMKVSPKEFFDLAKKSRS